MRSPFNYGNAASDSNEIHSPGPLDQSNNLANTATNFDEVNQSHVLSNSKVKELADADNQDRDEDGDKV